VFRFFSFSRFWNLVSEFERILGVEVMLLMPVVNWVAILVAAAVQMIVGYVWYSPMLFGNAWMKLSGIKKPEKMDDAAKSAMMTSMFWMFVGTIVTAFVLSGFIGYAGAKGLMEGAFVGVMAWLGFMVTSHAGMVLFDRKPFQLYLLNVGHMFVGIILAGAVLGYWA